MRISDWSSDVCSSDLGPYSGATGYDGLWTQLMHAAENDEVKAIFMPHNSGGGAVDGLEELAEAIYANSARFGGKPIWAMLADHSHSASYWLASAADKVFRSEEHTSELQSLMRNSYAVLCLKKKKI